VTTGHGYTIVIFLDGSCKILVGYLSSLIAILTPFTVAIIGIGMFTTLPTAILYASIIGLGSYLGARYHYKHNRPEAFDDRLTDQKMREARDWLIGRWKRSGR